MNMTLNGTNLSFHLVGDKEKLVFSLSTPTFLHTDVYEGITDITPNFEGLTLRTSHKIIADDITVKPIQVENVSNTSGGLTVFIGGII